VWIFPGSIFLFLATAAGSILRAEGDMRTPMRVMIVSVLLNAVLDPLLIFGIGFFPRLEVTGAAVATFVSRAVGCGLMITYLIKGDTSVRVRLKGFAYDGSIVRSILGVGFPASANHLIMSASGMCFIRILSAFGTAAVAAYGLVGRLNGIVILPCLGIATAVITIIGQNVGARKLDRAEATAWTSVLYAMLVMEGVGIAFFIWPRILMRMFTADAEVIAHGAWFLRIMSLTYMFIGVSIIMSSAFQGAGKGLPALAMTMLRLVVLAVPAAYLLSRWLGVTGVWIAMAGSSVIAGVVSAIWFRSGTWRRPSPT
jgi:putative MATE family efflux protein